MPLVPIVSHHQPAVTPRKVFDDLSTIAEPDRFYHVTFIEDRACFWAGDGDLVASCGSPIDGWEEYCTERLGLGSVLWLRPLPKGDSLSVAAACWTDRDVRHSIIRALRTAGLASSPGYSPESVHPWRRRVSVMRIILQPSPSRKS